MENDFALCTVLSVTFFTDVQEIFDAIADVSPHAQILNQMFN